MTVRASAQYQLRFTESLEEVAPADWNRLAGERYPFMRHEFLAALERTGCASAASGWQPCHALVEDGDELVAAMPLYMKTHSAGEYVFDWSWADAYYQHGLDYYPKFVTSIPFTPCTGPRIAIAEGCDTDAVVDTIVAGVKREAAERGVSGWHLLFPERSLSDRLEQRGMSRRLGCQFQWFNDGFSSFDDFLQSLNSRKRKNIRKERRRVAEQGITLRRLEGGEISLEQWRTFYRFYQNTYFVRGRPPYLNLPLFLELGRLMPENLLLVTAERQGETVAGALCLKDDEALFGRYWGCDQEFQFLHFEACFYQGLDYCIEHGLKRFDSGAQGEHKIQRGFKPVETYSNHWIADPRFSRAVEHFLEEEEKYVREYIYHAGDLLPFKKEAPDRDKSILEYLPDD